MSNYKILLISESGYNSKHEALLIYLLDEGYEWFSVIGKDCQMWAEAMDDLAIGDGTNPRSIVTTSHPDETVSDVLNMLEQVVTKEKSGIEVVRI